MCKIKIIIFFCFLFVISGCNKEEDIEKKKVSEDVFILEKQDASQDYVYLEEYRNLYYENGEVYKLQNLVVNMKSDAVDNVNLELLSFVKKSFHDMRVENGKLKVGQVIFYDYYITDKYISVLQKYYSYVNGSKGEEYDNVYVISLENGENLSKDALLQAYGYDEENLYSLLESKIQSDDVLYTLVNIKNNGYHLYVNKDGKLCIIYYEMDDVEEIRKELILDD